MASRSFAWLCLGLYVAATPVYVEARREGANTGNTPLLTLLKSLQFKNSGTVRSTDQFAWHNQPEMYLEPENVTTTCRGWQTWKAFNYLYKRDGDKLVPPPVGMRSAVPLGGISTGFFELRGDGSFHEWTLMNQTPGGAAKIQIFDEAFLAVSWNSGSRRSGGTGSENLKFRSKTRRQSTDEKMNIDDILKSSKIPHSGMLALRTHPSEKMKQANIEGVQGLEYSGAYPVTRLKVQDDRLPFDLTVYAFSSYTINDREISATPAVRFVPVIENPSVPHVTVKLHLVLPLGIEPRTERSVKFDKNNVVKTLNNISSEMDCFITCNKYYDACTTWTFDSTVPVCRLYTDARLNTFADGSSSGLRSSWSADTHGEVQCLSYVIPGTAPYSGNTSMCSPKGSDLKLAVFDELYQWNQISNQNQKSMQLNNGQSEVNVFGALSTAGFVVRAGETSVANPIVMSWFYPNKDFLRVIYGNKYTDLFENSLHAASLSHSSIEKSLNDILAVNEVFYNSSLPIFLQDMLLNSLSHIRSAMWFKDSRWRQWEAYDCTNIDSVHNDGERHIPYISFFPEAVKNKIQGWAKSQQPDGMIREQLHEGCGAIFAGKLDSPAGRRMSDVSSMFIVYVLEMYRWGNETQLLKDTWPYVMKAARWHLEQANSTGTVQNMVTTYDVVHLTAYTYSAYSTAFHLLAMRAAEELALIMGDKNLAQECRDSYHRAQDVLDTVQWNATAGYYNGYTQVGKSHLYRAYDRKMRKVVKIDPNKSPPGALMTDTFYSQVLAYSVGLGLLPKDVDKLQSHMKAEYDINSTPYGMLVLTGRYPYPGPPQDNAVWQMGNPNWAAINIHLGNDVDEALRVAEVTIDAWRSKVNDIWNVAGISGGLGYGAEGQPYITSHYGYFMSSWHIVMALTGQQANLPLGTLTFDPKVNPPYRYPVLLAGVLGSLEATGKEFSLCFKIGRSYRLEDISVGESHYPKVPVTLGAGSCVTWKQ